VASALVSLGSAVLYVLQDLVWGDRYVWHLTILGVFALPKLDAVWLLLGLASASTTGYLFAKARHRMKRYAHVLRRRSRSWTALAANQE